MLNAIKLRPGVAIIMIRKGTELLEVLIDPIDVAKADTFPGTWTSTSSDDGNVYVRGVFREGRKTYHVKLHRFLIEPPEDLLVDHINHDGLDNRRSNLRTVTTAVNNRNRGRFNRNNRSGHAGVYWSERTQRWHATIGNKHIGQFHTITDAITARQGAMQP